MNRKEVTDYIVKAIGDIYHEEDGFNVKRTRQQLESMSDEKFRQYMEDLGTEKKRLALIVPNGSKDKLNMANLFSVAKKYNVKLYSRIWFPLPDGGKYLSHDEYLILKLPLRRQSQLLVKKASIPQDSKTVDALSGQVAGTSKGSKVTYPEVQMFIAGDLKYSLVEAMKYRGGDGSAYRAMNAIMYQTGGVSQKAIEPFSSGVSSTKLLSVYLYGMHIDNNL